MTFRVDDVVMYGGRWAIVAGHGPGEYGQRVILQRRDGTQIATTPGLDPRFGEAAPPPERATWRDGHGVVHAVEVDMPYHGTVCGNIIKHLRSPFPATDFEAVTCAWCVANAWGAP